ncbi:hypothetical protein PSI23_21505 [Xenorhabdus sp. XENO-10]|uniref:Uncharacterized protein n=1 Tax=Xenorhabdus yunnanensis TaxID=3025878 RepID=A0ABT5LKY6_9GAMM|nr:hypothetical protein [Xenorhabdus yunnanensis]MDC9591782.1 hypothetical protein [Xenorhabdus yunnanensis]
MKINITVDLDWLEEDGNIDEEVKYQIIEGVKKSISRQCLDKVEKEASKQINQAINESINSAKATIEKKAIAFADEWLKKEVTVTDKWGDVQECLTITDLIKKSFDNTLEKKVDKNGNFTSSYDGIPLIKYLMSDRMQELVSKRVSVIQKDIDQAITNAVNNGIRENVSNKFAEMVVNTARQQHALESK